MVLLDAERVKLLSTRSSWWCMLLAGGLTVGLTVVVMVTTGPRLPVTVGTTQFGYKFGLVVTMVMATLAITTEYRFGTIKSTFQAIPDRTAALVSKAVVVASLAGITGELIAFTCLGVTRLIKPETDLALHVGSDWRAVAGVGLVYAVGAILALGVGLLIRQTAGAVTFILVWSLLVESLVGLVPTAGLKIQAWLPFAAGGHFLDDGQPGVVGSGSAGVAFALGPWGALAYYAGIALMVLVAGIWIANARDA